MKSASPAEARADSASREVLFHLAGRRKGDEETAGRGGDRRKRMRDAAGSQHGLAATQMHPLLAHLEGDFTLHHVEPFFLIEVQVEGRSPISAKITIDEFEWQV
jgi:hypothetical protein